MNVLKKVSVNVMFGVLAAGSVVAPANAAEAALPDLSRIAGEISAAIAREVRDQLRNALAAPRAERVRTPPSVTVIDTETVTVVATRLPPLDGAEDGAVRTAQIHAPARF